MDTASIVSDFKKKFRDFMDSRSRNAWIYPGRPRAADIYLRKSVRYIRKDGVMTYVEALDFANFAIAPRYRQRGLFTAFLGVIEEASEYVFVENVIGETAEYKRIIIAALLRRGYTRLPGGDDIAPCFIRRAT